MPSLSRVATVAGILAVSSISSASANPDPEHRTRGDAREPRKVALMIGIADYAHFGASPTADNPLADLQGPENDVRRLQVSLNRWGFGTQEDTRLLLGEEATKAGIAEGFRWIAARATEPGDAVVIYFSGHGSHAPDGPDKDETDGRDEGLVPYDAEDAHNPAQLVLDDEIREYLKAIGTENVTIIVDACYSGTVTRGHGDAVGRDKGPKPMEGEGLSDDASDDFTGAAGHTLITAAASTQTAQELPYDEGGQKVWIGALTYHLTRALDGAVEARGLRYDELLDRLRADVRGALLPQVPQLEGDRAAVLFRSNQGVAARPFVTVSSAVGGRVVLDAGAIHGVRRTAIYDVYRPGEMQFDAQRLARVRIDSVFESQSVGRFVDQQGAAFAPVRLPDAARAVPSLVPAGAPDVERLKVYVDPTAADLAADIAADSGRFVVVDSASASAVVTRERGVPQVLVRGIPLPPQPDEAVRVEFRAPPQPDGVVRVDTVAGYRPDALCRPLVRALSIRNLEQLHNPAPPAELSILARAVPKGSGAPRDLVQESRVDTVFVGDTVDLYVKVEVTSDIATDSRFFMSAAVAGYTSDPGVVYPWPGRPLSPVQLNRWTLIGRTPISEPVGSEILKVVANSDPYDLNPLIASFGTCERSRGVKGGFEPIFEPITGWTTLSHRIDVLRRPTSGN